MTRILAMTRIGTRFFFALLLALTVSTSASAQTSETYDVSDFTRISMSIVGEAYVTQDDAYSLRIEAPQRILDEIEARVRGGELEIRYRDDDWNDDYDDDRVDVYVSLPSVEGLAISGAATMTSENRLESDRLNLSISGAGQMTLDVAVGDLKTSMSGAGEATLKGTADAHRISVSGAGSVEAEDLRAARVDVSVSGTASCRVHATDALDVKVSGMGSIKYKGNPDVTQSVSGMASISKM